jgi:DNA sulfur modification protein DndC
VEIKPDTDSPSMVRKLTRYMLQLDYDEEQRALKTVEAPRFKLLPLQMMIAVDAMQNANGLARPFQIWADYRDIFRRGVRYDIPDIEPFPEKSIPATRYLPVQGEWEDDTFAGLRDGYVESLTELGNGTPELRHTADGRAIWDVDAGPEFEVDEEAAHMFFDFEYESILKKFDEGYGTFSGTIALGYKWYVLHGGIQLASSQVSKHDETLRRTTEKDRMGLTVDYDINDLVERSVAFKDLPESAQRAWKPKLFEEVAELAEQAVEAEESEVIDRSGHL